MRARSRIARDHASLRSEMDDRKLDSLVRPSELLLETPAHCLISLDHPPCSCQSVLAKCDANAQIPQANQGIGWQS